VTYESFAGAWPQRRDEIGFADKMNAMPKYVVSSTLEDPEWENSTAVRGDIGEIVSSVKQQVDGEILVAGSRMLAQELLQRGLADEVRLLVFPVMLGSGRRFYPDSPDKLSLELFDCQQFGVGTLALRYRPRG
jgi:dihydrofolate reductase